MDDMTVVWVDGWQMQCCGEPFSVGDTIRWTVGEPLSTTHVGLIPSIGIKVDHTEEHHGSATAAVVGTVQSIRLVHDLPPGHERSLRSEWTHSADGQEGTTNSGRERLRGYLVRLLHAHEAELGPSEEG